MTSESEKFDQAVRKVLSVSREELARREQAWKTKRSKITGKRTKTSPASHVSDGKD